MSNTDYLDPLRERLAVEYRQHLAHGAVCVQRCVDCGVRQFPPLMYCANCSSDHVTWHAVAGGRVVSAITKAGRDGSEVTAVIVGVEGCRLPARGRAGEALKHGDEVAFVFEEPTPKAAVVTRAAGRAS